MQYGLHCLHGPTESHDDEFFNSQVSFSSLISSRALDSEKQGIKKAFKIASSCLMLFRFVDYKSMENPATVSFPDSHCLLSTPLFDFPSWKMLAAVLHLVSLTKTGCKGFFFVISIILIETMGIVTRICNALPEMDSSECGIYHLWLFLYFFVASQICCKWFSLSNWSFTPSFFHSVKSILNVRLSETTGRPRNVSVLELPGDVLIVPQVSDWQSKSWQLG